MVTDLARKWLQGDAPFPRVITVRTPEQESVGAVQQATNFVASYSSSTSKMRSEVTQKMQAIHHSSQRED